MVVSVKVTGPGIEDLKKASRKIKEAANPREVRKELTRALRESTKPTVAEVKAEALALPAHGRHTTGLRRRIARGTSASVRLTGNAGVKVRISRKVLGDQAPVPLLMNRGLWRHPVFGADVWVQQTGDKGWFDRVILRHKREVVEGVKRAIDGIERRLKV